MRIIDEIVGEFRNGLTVLVQDLDGERLTPQRFVGFVAQLRNLLNETGLKAFVETVGRHEEHSDVFEHGGQIHRFKMESKKEWITPFGLALLARRYFQPYRGGEGVVPLDLRCGMVDRPMTPDIEELCAFSAAHLVPREVETLLGKLLPHRPSATAVQHVIRHVGAFAEEAEADIEAAMRKEGTAQSPGRRPRTELGRCHHAAARKGAEDGSKARAAWHPRRRRDPDRVEGGGRRGDLHLRAQRRGQAGAARHALLGQDARAWDGAAP